MGFPGSNTRAPEVDARNAHNSWVVLSRLNGSRRPHSPGAGPVSSMGGRTELLSIVKGETAR